jgi:hypothetical protein
MPTRHRIRAVSARPAGRHRGGADEATHGQKNQSLGDGLFPALR